MIGAKIARLMQDTRPAWAVGMSAWSDFTAGRGNLPAITDTHAATIYAPNAAGVYSPFAANVLTRTDLGLQTVPTRQQLASSPYATSTAQWTVTNATKTAAQPAPAGLGTDAALITSTAVAGQAFTQASNSTVVSYTSGTSYTFSAFLRPGTQNLVQLTAPSGAFGAAQYANFDLATGVVVTAVGCTATISPSTGGYYRLGIVVAATSTTTGSSTIIAFIASGVDTRLPNVTLATTFYAVGGEVYASLILVPPILSAATVNGNLQVISGLGTQLATGVAGVVQITCKQPATNFPAVLNFYDTATGTSRAFFYLTTSGGSAIWQQQTTPGDPTSANQAVGTWVQDVPFTVAFIFTNNYVTARIVGQSQSAIDTVTTYGSMDTLSIGGRGLSADANAFMFTSKLGLRYLAPGDDPATVVAQMVASGGLM